MESLSHVFIKNMGAFSKINSSDFILYSERDDSFVNQTTFNL